MPIGAMSAGSRRVTHIRCLQISRPPLAGTFPILHLYAFNMDSYGPLHHHIVDVIYTLGIGHSCYFSCLLGRRGVKIHVLKIHTVSYPLLLTCIPVSFFPVHNCGACISRFRRRPSLPSPPVLSLIQSHRIPFLPPSSYCVNGMDDGRCTALIFNECWCWWGN